MAQYTCFRSIWLFSVWPWCVLYVMDDDGDIVLVWVYVLRIVVRVCEVLYDNALCNVGFVGLTWGLDIQPLCASAGGSDEDEE